MFALMTFAFDAMKVARDTPADVTNPAALLVGLLVFFVAVAAAKVFWVPLHALSGYEVEKRQSTNRRIDTALWIVLIAGALLSKCGF